jgi:hypothetical protein
VERTDEVGADVETMEAGEAPAVCVVVAAGAPMLVSVVLRMPVVSLLQHCKKVVGTYNPDGGLAMNEVVLVTGGSVMPVLVVAVSVWPRQLVVAMKQMRVNTTIYSSRKSC